MGTGAVANRRREIVFENVTFGYNVDEPVLHDVSFRIAPGERVGIGQRIGFLYFGNIVDVFMPSTAVPEAQIGADTRAGSTVLGHLEAVAARPGSATRVS